MAVRRVGLAGYGLRLAIVLVAYFVAARLSLQLAQVHGQVTPVWPPTGIALVAILLLGRRMWPAIAAAAFAVNAPLGPNVLGAACIAAGNTLAPLVAAYLMQEAGFRPELNRLRDAAALRFRLPGAAPAALIASGVAVWAAVNGTGPFAQETLLQKMVTLQVFNVFVALASFVFVAYVETREREQRARLSSEAKSEFLRVASHELRSPLSVLSGYLSLLASGDLGEPPARWREPLEILSAKTQELNDIMDDLLEVSRFDGDAMLRAREVVDLGEVVEAAVERARARAALVEGKITVERTSDPLAVMADAGQLGHVMDILVNNAISYTREPARVAVCAVRNDGRAVVRVIDNGVGVPGEFRGAMFEPFRRGRQAGVESVAGTGLGLYIGRELARSHGGDLLLEERAPGAGSTFALSLPLAVTGTLRRA